jgi:drug/metabolite transporter (DMT)-like permease
MRKNIVVGHVALLAVQIFFGHMPIFATLAFVEGGFSPLGVGAWRIGSGALVLGGLAFISYGRDAIPRRGDLLRFAICAFLGIALNQGLFLTGLSLSTPMNAGLVMSLIPVFTFAIAAMVRQERFSSSRAAGVAIALAGATLLLVGQGASPVAGHGLGNTLMVLNALAYSAYLIISKQLLSRYRSLVVIAWIYMLSTPYLPYFLWGAKVVADPGHALAWWSLAYVIVFPTILAYLLNMFALARLRATTTAVYVYLQPLITGVASWVVFGERLTAVMGFAAVCLFVGIWLVSRVGKR